jgi:hypothetical protein
MIIDQTGAEIPIKRVRQQYRSAPIPVAPIRRRRRPNRSASIPPTIWVAAEQIPATKKATPTRVIEMPRSLCRYSARKGKQIEKLAEVRSLITVATHIPVSKRSIIFWRKAALALERGIRLNPILFIHHNLKNIQYDNINANIITANHKDPK